jgi:hypothetical protein
MLVLATVCHCELLQTVSAEHTRSLLFVLLALSNCVSKSQVVSAVQTRSLCQVLAVLSYCVL